MESTSRIFSISVFFAIIFSLPNAATALADGELNSMLAVLRSRGYNLFCNAITTSDLLYDVLDGDSFTFFVPTDSSLFALDMTNTASDYIASLRYHVVPRRLALNDLGTLPSGSSVPTLVPRQEIRVERRMSPWSDLISVDGVDVVLPGLFYGHSIAVHGLAGILSLRSQFKGQAPQGSAPLPPPVNNSSGNHSSQSPPVNQNPAAPPVNHYPPPPHVNLTGNHSSPGDSHRNHSLSPSPANSSRISQPPKSDETHNHTVEPPAPAPAVVGGYSPVHSPSLHPDPAIRSPSAAHVRPNQGDRPNSVKIPGIREISLIQFAKHKEREVTSGISEKLPDISPGKKMTARSRELHEKSFDCPLTDEETPLDETSFQENFLYTDQQPLTDSAMTCASK